MTIEDSVFVYRLSEGDHLLRHGRYHAHKQNEYEIHYFIEGSGHFLCNKTRYPISKGKLFLTGPLEFHSIIPEPHPTEISWYAFLFSLDETKEADQKLKASLNYALASKNTFQTVDTNFRFQFEDLFQLSRSPKQSFKDAALSLLMSFLWRWFGQTEELLSSENERNLKKQTRNGHIDKVHVEKALLYMQKQVRENVKVESIAKKVDLSSEHFIRIFKNYVHMTPGQYFTRLKIEGASGLLMSSNKNIGEISDWFGFENQFHFSKVFRKCTGMSPIEYRKTYLQTFDFS